MFAYCASNPVNYTDITGSMHVKGTDACGGLKKDYIYGTTFSLGISYGYTKGTKSSNTSYVFSTDNDTLAIQKTDADGISTGLGASAGLVITLTNANNICDLEGESASVGGTIVVQAKGFSVDYIEFNPKSNSDVLCRGISITIPFGAEAEIHEYISNTKTLKEWQTPIVAFLEYLIK